VIDELEFVTAKRSTVRALEGPLSAVIEEAYEKKTRVSLLHGPNCPEDVAEQARR